MMDNSFLQQTAKSIIAKLNWQQLRRTTLVLPSHRAGQVLKSELLRLQKEQQQKAVWAPEVMTLQQLQDALSPLYAEDELFSIVRLYRHYRQLAQDNPMSMDLFYNWGRQMLADFTNIDASMPSAEVDNFFDNTIAAHELSRWELEPEVEARLKVLLKGDEANEEASSTYVKEQYEQLWRNLHTLYSALREEMKAEQKGYAGMRQRAVIEQWQDESVQTQINGRMYVFVGFNYLLPVERELMMLLRDNNQALFYWDFVSDFVTNEKAFSFAKLNSGILGNANANANANATPKPVTVMACTSREAQAQYVHRWLTENYTAKGQKVGIVICDESMLESVIYALPAITPEGEEECAKVNITKGFPLRHTAVYARVLDWLYDRKRGDVEQLVSPDFIDQLLDAIQLQEPAEEEANANTDSLSWQELLIIESEYQVRKMVNQMRLIVAEGLGDVPFTLKLFRLLMRRVMESITMPFHGETDTDIQVMGVLETRMLDFDKLLLLNVEEGVIPQTQADNSFIPYYLRKAYSMQTSDERATVYAYNFFRLLSRAGHATLLFTTTDGGENRKGMSRFIMQMLVSPEFTVEKVQLKEHSVLQPLDEARLSTSGVRFTGSSLSPSALNNFIICPRLFCFNQIQGVRGEDEDDVLFGAASLGTIVHDTMLYLYQTHLGCSNGTKTPVSPQSIEKMLNDDHFLEQGMEHAYRKNGFNWDEDHKPERSIILTYVRNILERDKEDAEVGLKIYLLEAGMYFNIEVPEGELSTGGRIDRVDFYGPEGHEVMRVIDYKSGTYKPAALVINNGIEGIMDHPDKNYIRQLLIYCQALMEQEAKKGKPIPPIVPHIYFCSHALKGEQTGLTVKSQHSEPLEQYQDIREQFLEQLRLKVSELLNTTDFPPCEEGKCPNFCRFLAVCGRKARTQDD